MRGHCTGMSRLRIFEAKSFSLASYTIETSWMEFGTVDKVWVSEVWYDRTILDRLMMAPRPYRWTDFRAKTLKRCGKAQGGDVWGFTF